MRCHRGISVQLVRQPRQPIELRLGAPSERASLEPEEPAEQRTERRRTPRSNDFAARGSVARQHPSGAAPASIRCLHDTPLENRAVPPFESTE